MEHGYEIASGHNQNVKNKIAEYRGDVRMRDTHKQSYLADE